MTTYDFDEPVNRKGTLSVKWNPANLKAMCGNPDAEAFWVADMDFKAAPEIMDAAMKAAASGTYGYPYFDGAKEAFCAFAKKRHDWDVKPEEVTITQGVLSSISMLVDEMSKEGDGIIIPFPAYKPFPTICDLHKRTILRWPLSYDRETHAFSYDWKSFETLAPRAKLVIFCNPQNPSGIEATQEDLAQLGTLSRKYGLGLISDEIHADLTFGRHIPLVEVAEKYGVAEATCMAPSKTFNIAGEHFSVVVTKDEKLRKALETRMSLSWTSETSFFSTTVALAAYRHGYDWLMQLLDYLQGNIAAVEKAISPKLHFNHPSASFVTLIDCSDIYPLIEKDAETHPELYTQASDPGCGKAACFFGQRARVCCNDGRWFGGDDYKRFVRFNYAVRRSFLLEAVERMNKAVDWLAATYS